MKSITKSAIALAATLMLALGAAGCQPNPTTPPVVNKGNLEDKIKDKTGAPEVSSTPAPNAADRMQKGYQNGKLVVNIDAAIQQPSTALPVVKVSPRKFTQAEVDTFIRVLLQGKPAYQQKGTMTKAEVQQQLIEMKAMKAQAKKGDKLLDKINAAISSLEEQLITAPETAERQVSDGKLITDDMGNQALTVSASLGKTAEASLSVSASKSGRTTSLWFTNEEQGQSYLGTDMALTGAAKGVTMSYEQAKALAVKTVKDLGSDLTLAGSSLGVSRDMKTGGIDPNGHQAYLFAFTREVNGVLCTYDERIGGTLPQADVEQTQNSGGDYTETHPYERILMAIDDTGILELQWLSPDTVGQTVSANAETLPFSTVMETFQKQFFIHNALKNKSNAKPGEVGSETGESVEAYAKRMRGYGIYNSDTIGYGESVKTCTYHIDRIVLGLTRIAVKDKPGEFMIVPAYDFFGSFQVEYTAESGYQGFTSIDPNTSFLTINAIDGSIINRDYGY